MPRYIYINMLDKLFLTISKASTQLANELDILLLYSFIRWYFPDMDIE